MTKLRNKFSDMYDAQALMLLDVLPSLLLLFLLL